MMVDDVVHVDIDNEEWGRICSDGVVLEVFEHEALINIIDIRANVLIPIKDIKEL